MKRYILSLALVLLALPCAAQVSNNPPPLNRSVDRNLLLISAVQVNTSPGTNCVVTFVCDTQRMLALQRMTGDTNTPAAFVAKWLNASALRSVQLAKQKQQARVQAQSGVQFLTNSTGP